MTTLDYLVLAGYFAVMAAIGVGSMRKIKAQEDFFLGGRAFGKLLQTFAAFGAGTGSSDPVNTARTTFTSGMSGMWSIMSWLFVTPFYWITAVWYRRMRHLTLGDWFVERYESRAMGAAYTVFGVLFYVVYTAMLFTAVGKFAAPLLGDTVVLPGGGEMGVEYVLVPIVALMVLVYGVLGGLTAAYWTDTIQGICIIVLSVMLIPFGLAALGDKFGEVYPGLSGFEIMHRELPENLFTIVGAGGSEFPPHRILAVIVILLVGAVVMPHFIATGGGSAKSELNARIGLVTGNLLKRFCTIGWALTALIVLTLYADNPDLLADPDRVWGVASRELLVPGLVGLMLACMLAALMSSADTYMLVCAALMVRNVYAPYFDPDADERRCIFIGRVTAVIMIGGAVAMAWSVMDVFRQLELTWIVPMVFAAPFWVGMFWRRATTAGAWVTIGYVVVVFFIVPLTTPLIAPSMRTSDALTATNHLVTTVSRREAAPVDVRKREAEIARWRAAGGGAGDEAPEPLGVGDMIEETRTTGGSAIYWTGSVTAVGERTTSLVEQSTGDDGGIVRVERYDGPMRASGNFKPDFLLYAMLGVDLRGRSDAMLATMELAPKIITPFIVMILVSLITPRNGRAALDRFYVKMKTPVAADPEADRVELEKSYADPARFDYRKLLPGTQIEAQKPRASDIIGFIVSVGLCFVIVWLAAVLAGIGG